MTPKSRLIAAVAIAAALAGCRHKGDIVVDEGVGITAVRGVCPAVGIPDYTGDVTLFHNGGETAQDIDVVAAMTNVRTQCDDDAKNATANVRAGVSFDVLARRTDTHGARQVLLPYYVTIVRGGTAVISKRIGQVEIDFADGQDRAYAHGQGSATIDRTEATLPQEMRDRITRKRRAGAEDAAIDPLSEPEIRAAVARASFELLVGFQLDDAQLAYNVKR